MGLAILAVFVILIISGSILLLRPWTSGHGQIGHRVPLPPIGYCPADQAEPCIVSFTLDPDGTMVINIRTENRSLPTFNLKIKRGEDENFYVCRRANGFSLNIICTGQAMPAGESLQFLLLSKRDNTLLAEGTFPIIGLALATPEPAMTPTIIPAWDRPPK